MSDIVHGGITVPCSSLWRRGNGHLVSLRTYSSCVLVRSDMELLLEGVDDMVLVERALCAVWVQKKGRDFIWSCDQRDRSQKDASRTLVNTRTHLYGTLTDYQRHNKTLSWFGRSHSAEWLSSGRSVAASRRQTSAHGGQKLITGTARRTF